VAERLWSSGKLRELLTHSSPRVRGWAVNAFRNWYSDQAGPVAVDMLSDPDPDVRGIALSLLADDPEASDPERVLEMFRGGDTEARAFAARILEQVSYQPAVPDLLAWLLGSPPVLRTRAPYIAVARLGSDETVEKLLGLLSNSGTPDAVKSDVLAACMLAGNGPHLAQALKLALQDKADLADMAIDLLSEMPCAMDGLEAALADHLDAMDDRFVARDWFRSLGVVLVAAPQCDLGYLLERSIDTGRLQAGTLGAALEALERALDGSFPEWRTWQPRALRDEVTTETSLLLAVSALQALAACDAELRKLKRPQVKELVTAIAQVLGGALGIIADLPPKGQPLTAEQIKSRICDRPLLTQSTVQQFVALGPEHLQMAREMLRSESEVPMAAAMLAVTGWARARPDACAEAAEDLIVASKELGLLAAYEAFHALGPFAEGAVCNALRSEDRPIRAIGVRLAAAVGTIETSRTVVEQCEKLMQLDDAATLTAILALGDSAAIEAVRKDWRPGGLRLSGTLRLLCELHAVDVPELAGACTDCTPKDQDLNGPASEGRESGPAQIKPTKLGGLRLPLRCTQCGRSYLYEVGQANVWLTYEAPASHPSHLFSNRITCRRCGAVERYGLTDESALMLLAECYTASLYDGSERAGHAVRPLSLGTRFGFIGPEILAEVGDRRVADAPKDPEARFGHGWALCCSRQYEPAAREFEKALELAPGSWAPMVGLGYAYHRLGEDARAVEWYRKCAPASTDRGLNVNALRIIDGAQRAANVIEAGGDPGWIPFHLPTGSDSERSGEAPDEQVQRPVQSPGRNDPCHCGSGKKYKKCCMRKDLEGQAEQAAEADI
jgi:tetratricopeptide (TPR) repeat protein